MVAFGLFHIRLRFAKPNRGRTKAHCQRIRKIDTERIIGIISITNTDRHDDKVEFYKHFKVNHRHSIREWESLFVWTRSSGKLWNDAQMHLVDDIWRKAGGIDIRGRKTSRNGSQDLRICSLPASCTVHNTLTYWNHANDIDNLPLTVKNRTGENISVPSWMASVNAKRHYLKSFPTSQLIRH